MRSARRQSALSWSAENGEDSGHRKGVAENPLGGGAWIDLRPATQFDVEKGQAEVSRALASIAAGGEAAELLSGVLGEDFEVEALKDRARLEAAAMRLSEIYLVMECGATAAGVAAKPCAAGHCPGAAAPQPGRRRRP